MAAVAVIGAGGMGSWFARFFKSKGDSVTVCDIDQSKARRLAARVRARYSSTNFEAARGSDIVVLATPANVVSNVVKEISPALRRGAFLLDLCAIKSAVAPALRSAQRRGVIVASIHPMFGPLASGLRGRTIIVVRIGKDKRAVEMVKRLFPEARILLTDLKTHDRQMAVTLALPHFLNMLFATTISRTKKLAELRKFAGRTFSLQMLLAETVANDPETTADIQIMNREFAAVLRNLQRDIRSLRKVFNRGDRTELVNRYGRVRQLLSNDPEFGTARSRFEKVCEATSMSLER